MLKLAYIGDPILHKKTKEISAKELASAKFQLFLKDFIATAKRLPAAGLAAPQVFKNFRVFCVVLEKEHLTYEVIKSGKNSTKNLIVPDEPFAIINPTVEPLNQVKDFDLEACLSIPYYAGTVARFTDVKVSFLDKNGEKIVIHAHGFMARVIQHEFDHLNGTLWLDRIQSTKDI